MSFANNLQSYDSNIDFINDILFVIIKDIEGR